MRQPCLKRQKPGPRVMREPGFAGIRPGLAGRIIRHYFSSESTLCWLWLACASIAVDAWLRIWAFESAVDSAE